MTKKIFRILLFVIVINLGGCGFYEEIREFYPNAFAQVDSGDQNEISEVTELDRYFYCEGYRYWYQTLTLTERIWYEDIENILCSMAQKSDLSKEGLRNGLTEEEIDRIFQCVMMDHPELFFVDGYVYTIGKLGDKTEKISFSGTYNVTYEEAVRRKNEIEKYVEPIVAGAPKTTDDYELIKYVYEDLIRETDYDLDAPDNQNIYSVFVGKLSVCQGYAKATQYLLNRLGVKCTLVSGRVQGGNLHGWNLVNSNGDYYFVDTTWGDASYNSSEEDKQIDLTDINYDYLCVTTEELSRTHQFEEGMEVPCCNAVRDNYFVRQGLYFTSLDQEQLKQVFQAASFAENQRVTIKCDSRVLYEQMRKLLIEDGNVFQYYSQAVGSIVYVQNDEQYSMTFWVTN